MTLYFATDIIDPLNGEVLYLPGEELTEAVLMDLMKYGIVRFEVSIHKPALNRVEPSKDGWESLVEEDLIDF